MTFQVKICGIRDAATLDLAVRSGAGYVGFVFYPPSPRSLDIFAAAELAAGVPDEVASVGVLVDPDDRSLDGLLAHVALDILQLHGDESPERAAAVRERTGCRVMKALKVREPEDLAAADRYRGAVDLIMLDAKPRPGALLPGGNGEAIDWSILDGFAPPCPWALAGGLNPDNLSGAVAATHAAIYDVSSGVERAPGIKDPDKVAAFLAVARELRAAHPVK
ncbi:MAG: phosphoribosylanthranilate isomerase [Geminicoccaceae bacterium]